MVLLSPMIAGQRKPEEQWLGDERKAANLDQRLKNSPDDEEDTKSSQEYLNNLEEEYQERALLAKSKRFFKKGSQMFTSAKVTDDTICYKCGRKVNAKLALLSFGTSSKSSMVKNKRLVAEAYEWDKEDVSSDDNEMTEVKVLMALADDENVVVGKESARNGEWVKITMRKVHTLVDIEDSDERKSFLDYLCIDLNYVEEQRNNLVILLFESQVNTTDPPVVVTDSSATKYDFADESSVCSTPLPLLEKLTGAEPCERTDHRTCDHAEYMSTINMSQHLKSQGGSSSRSRTPRPSKHFFPPCIHNRKNQSDTSKHPSHKVCKRGNNVVFLLALVCATSWGVRQLICAMLVSVTSGNPFGTWKVDAQGILLVSYALSAINMWKKPVAFVNGLKYNLVSISQLCDAKYIVQFDEKRGTIFNSNKEIVMIAPRDKPCSSCEKGKHHRASFKTKQTSFINKCLRLLHMELFGLVTHRSTIVKRHLKTPYEIFRGRIPNIDFLNVFGYPVYIHNHKDYLGKFGEKADDGYFLGYSLVSKAFRVFNTQRQQTEETCHITIDESTDAINFTKSSDDNITIADSERYPPDKYLHPYEPSQRYQVNRNVVYFIDLYERPEPVVIEIDVSSDQHDQHDQANQNDQNDHSAQNDEILNDDQSKNSNHNNDNHIIDNLPNTEDVPTSRPLSSPAEDASVSNTVPISTNPSLSIPSMV
ncbi:retrovirus-related pol polyprotein from transposon TNT 1-94 [Tanacetum coccineum]|uniref:Retrovirus-related pol polyprotein from transposon TNT 1-94 n=1 Tax=Tanacetum coccineum TaxID=301880 RepID=A0ABQ5GMK7_9ASTR